MQVFASFPSLPDAVVSLSMAEPEDVGSIPAAAAAVQVEAKTLWCRDFGAH